MCFSTHALESRPVEATYMTVVPALFKRGCCGTAAAAAVRRLGAGVKVINCVMMDNVSVADGSHIQNCVICSGAVIQERATLKDCQVCGVVCCIYYIHVYTKVSVPAIPG